MGTMGLFLGQYMVWRRGVGALPQAAVLGNRWRRSTSLHHIVCGLYLQIASPGRSCAWHTAGQYIFRHIYYQSKRKAFSNLFSNHSPVLNARVPPSLSPFFSLHSSKSGSRVTHHRTGQGHMIGKPSSAILRGRTDTSASSHNISRHAAQSKSPILLST